MGRRQPHAPGRAPGSAPGSISDSFHLSPVTPPRHDLGIPFVPSSGPAHVVNDGSQDFCAEALMTLWGPSWVQRRGTEDKMAKRPPPGDGGTGAREMENQAGQKTLPPEVDRDPSAHRALSQPVTRPH